MPPAVVRMVLAVVAEGALIVLLTKLVGTPVLWSALIGAPIAAVLLLLLTTPPGVEPTWDDPPAPPTAATHLEASTLAGRLQDASTDTGRFRSRIQPRLAALALARCAGGRTCATCPTSPTRGRAGALGPSCTTCSPPEGHAAGALGPAGLLDRLEEQ